MQIGELFLQLDIKGADKAVSSLAGIEKNLKNVGTQSLEAKAAIIAAGYALEQLFAKSGAAGTELTNFNALMGGKSIQVLQQYQGALRQVGISNEETENTFKSLSSLMSKVSLGQARPAGLAQIAQLTGGNITQQEVQDYAAHPELLLKRLQDYAQKEKRINFRNEALKSFGLSDNLIGGLIRGGISDPALKKAPTYSDKEVAQLDKANIAWSNLGTKIQMAIGHFNAKHGGQFVNDISKIVPQVISLAEAMTKFAEKAKIFEIIEMSTKGWVDLLKTASGIIDSLTSKDTNKPVSTKKNIEEQTSLIASDFVSDQEAYANNDYSVKHTIANTVNSINNTSNIDNTNIDPKVIGNQLASGLTSVKQALDKVKIANENSSPLPEDFFVKQSPISNNGTENNISNNETNYDYSGRNVSHNIENSNAPNSYVNNILNPAPERTDYLRLAIPESPLLPLTSGTNNTPNITNHNNSQGSTNQTFNVNQSLSFKNDGNPNNTANHVKKAVLDAFRQLPSQGTGG